MNNFLKKLAGFSLGPVLGALISFLTVPITTYFISPAEFGKASMFSVVQSLIVTFIYLGIDQSYAREYHYAENKQKLFQNAIFLPLLASLFFSLVIISNSTYFSMLLFDSPDYRFISFGFAIMVVASIIERFILLSIRMEEKAIEYSFFSIFVKLTILVVTVLLLALGYRSFQTVIISTILGQVVGDVFLCIRYTSLLKFNKKYIDKDYIFKMLSFGLPLIFAASVSNLLNTSGRLFLRSYSDYYELGIYNAALKVSNLLQIIQAAFTSFWVPTAYRWNKERRDMKHFTFISDALLLIMTLTFFFLLIFKDVIVMILSEGYSDAQYIIGLLTLTPILYTLSETSTLGIVFSGKSYLNIWVSVLSLIPNLILNRLLVPAYGLVGAAIASATTYVIFCLARTYFSKMAGFQIKFKKQVFNIFLFMLAAIVNVSSSEWVMHITLFMLSVSILSQISTFKTLNEIRKKSFLWDFS